MSIQGLQMTSWCCSLRSKERERLPAIGEKYAKEKTGAVSHAPVRDLDISLFDQPY